MNIAYMDMYGDAYEKDKCFVLDNCNIGQNLLLPGIKLQEQLKREGHEYHTLDLYDIRDVDICVIQDIPRSIYTCDGKEKFKIMIKDFLHILKKGKSIDNFKNVIHNIPINRRILLLLEPPVVSPKSYEARYHKFFGKILTWDDDLVDNKKYYKIYYPQPLPNKEYYVPFDKKKFITLIAGNKNSDYKEELYSKRLEVINWLENQKCDFDLYGFGWSQKEHSSYKGIVDDKLETLSKYKYAVCYENMCGIKGYVTEKIFDCFFSNVIPIYWGADNIEDYVPQNCFIDRRDFSTFECLYQYLNEITEEEYAQKLENIHNYLLSERFTSMFSVDSYIKRMIDYYLR